MTDLSHAIEQLRWLITDDFAERRCSTWNDSDGSHEYWWQCRVGRKDIERVRSYIDAVRVLEAAQR